MVPDFAGGYGMTWSTFKKPGKGFKSKRAGPTVSRETHGGEPKAAKPLAKAPNYARTQAVAVPKEKPHRSQKLRESANGEACLVRIPGCDGDNAKTIWSHYRGSAGGKGGARKSDDLCGAYACTFCDGIYDGQIPRPAGWTKEQVDLAWMDGHIRSLARVIQKGLL